MNKYDYIRVIQFKGDASDKWEDLCTYDRSEFSQIRSDLREYRLSGYGYYRVIDRRVRRTE